MNEKFDPMTLKPFDKVLARCTGSVWVPTLFGYFIESMTMNEIVHAIVRKVFEYSKSNQQSKQE